jgi:hypothetical protein
MSWVWGLKFNPHTIAFGFDIIMISLTARDMVTQRLIGFVIGVRQTQTIIFNNSFCY